MPRVLAIETSGNQGSVALAEGDRLLHEEQFSQGLNHAAEMVLRIDALCARQGWSPADLQEIYISAGPGSFTGLRIGITFAKVLAFATGARLVAVPSTDVLVANAPPEAQNAIIVLDAKREQIFTARYQRSADGWTVREPAHLDDLPSMLQRSPRPLHLIGEGLPYHRQWIASLDTQVVITEPELWRARAAVVVTVGAAMAAKGFYTDPDRLIPIYIRRPEAEEKFDAMQR